MFNKFLNSSKLWEKLQKKIYCCDRDNNDNALAAAILAGNNRRDDWGPMAAMMGGGMNNWMNNPFAYLMFMALLRNGGFGFGGDGAGTATQGIETQAQLNAIRTQLQDNQNADCIKSAIQGNGFALSQLAQTLNIDFNTLQKCCCDVQAACLRYAHKVANDPDGYDGMIFCRWTADAIGKAIKLDWEKFV